MPSIEHKVRDKSSSVSDEDLLVPLPARPSGSVPEKVYFTMRLPIYCNWEVLFFLIFRTVLFCDLIRKMLYQLLLDIHVNT